VRKFPPVTRKVIAERVMAALEFDEALAVVIGWQAGLLPEQQTAARAALCGRASR
jgi:hypothetical protein